MCGRFSLIAGGERVADLFGLDTTPTLFPRYISRPDAGRADAPQAGGKPKGKPRRRKGQERGAEPTPKAGGGGAPTSRPTEPAS
jgi:hypothetical protein